jgi:sigma-B regulation protein RsbU (phosphoserine phosphatase)
MSGGPMHLASAESGTLLQTADWPNGEPHIVAFEPIPTADWIFAAAIPEQDVLGPVLRQLAWNVGVLVIGGVFMAGIVLVMGLRLTGDVRRLGSAVARVTAGELNATVDHIWRRDELGILAQDFNTMTRQLEDTVAKAAEEAAARLAVERELNVAREIQAEMLPHEYPVLPGHPEVDLFAINVPARHVAGDFYDYWVRGDLLTAVLADVAGSGMPAALVMVRAMTLLRLFDDPDVPLTEVVARSNVELCDDNDRQIFVTGVIVRYNLTNGSFELVSAGHLPALICRGGEVSEEGDSTGPLLGVIPDGTWTSRCGTLHAGEWLSFYTDGITEARNATGAMLDTEGLREGLQALQAKDAQVLSRQGIAIAEHWHGGHVEDDLSMLVLRRT